MTSPPNHPLDSYRDSSRRGQQSAPRRWWLWLLAAVVIAVIVYFVFLRHASTPSTGQPSAAAGAGAPGGGGGRRGGGAGMGQQATPVGATVVKPADVNVFLTALGTVTPLNTVTVRTQISGQLLRVQFQEGQLVKQGDLLAEVDPRPYQAQLAQYEGQLARDQALLKNARIDLDRYQTLVKQDSAPEQQLATQQALVEQYIGTVKTDQAQIDGVKLNLIYARITAPIGGRVGLRQVDPGNYVQTGDTNGIVVITQLSPVNVVFTLPEDNIPTVLKSFNAGNKLVVAAYDRSLTTKLADGNLASVDNQIDATTGTVKLKAQFANTDESLFANQFVNVKMLTNTLHDALVIPSSAIERGTQGTYVYVLKDDHTVTARVVTLGPTEGEQVAVLTGVTKGETVVSDGADRLREGAAVTLPNEQPAAAVPAVQPAADGTIPRKPGEGRHRPQNGAAPAANPAAAAPEKTPGASTPPGNAPTGNTPPANSSGANPPAASAPGGSGT
ncbi:MdtA/MuxA family multidrug efflux RND transporter periplasmic adaptor subunit [Pseudolysobacter antarcticus]|uniref:MdtA/MuxA family multidrug efflux RND transporter periplasmic adaptor subunit n=1 Tax=Pseudolysobacter antarcticus TaxID=2511995 RepID=A0A411HI36_9GAMM|nr:MdtA/MuxA family multidrug efflux RND transporter periplasmic adaptor subunit [Pseudolysobacter antarcticus]QBB70175.1 MdtA/MuxA family multidrug efflux RND transporter periplasmic adaptor subunit [Pseudolysobacter antarcticus]